MNDIRIRRHHVLGLARARQLAWQWAQRQGGQAMTSQVMTGDTRDVVRFSRAGVDGTLVIAADYFELTAALGFLMGALKPLIEAEMGRSLDALMAGEAPGKT